MRCSSSRTGPGLEVAEDRLESSCTMAIGSSILECVRGNSHIVNCTVPPSAVLRLHLPMKQTTHRSWTRTVISRRRLPQHRILWGRNDLSRCNSAEVALQYYTGQNKDPVPNRNPALNRGHDWMHDTGRTAPYPLPRRHTGRSFSYLHDCSSGIGMLRWIFPGKDNFATF